MQERKKQIESVDKATYSIPEAGAMVDLSRNGAYDAARRGGIPVLQFGRKKGRAEGAMGSKAWT
jgi:hypothetical protein